MEAEIEHVVIENSRSDAISWKTCNEEILLSWEIQTHAMLEKVY